MEPDHLTPADVFGFVEDDLDPVWLELVWEHLDCEECLHYQAMVLGANTLGIAHQNGIREG